jgi:hypothetical protein
MMMLHCRSAPLTHFIRRPAVRGITQSHTEQGKATFTCGASMLKGTVIDQ